MTLLYLLGSSSFGNKYQRPKNGSRDLRWLFSGLYICFWPMDLKGREKTEKQRDRENWCQTWNVQLQHVEMGYYYPSLCLFLCQFLFAWRKKCGHGNPSGCEFFEKLGFFSFFLLFDVCFVHGSWTKITSMEANKTEQADLGSFKYWLLADSGWLTITAGNIKKGMRPKEARGTEHLSYMHHTRQNRLAGW